MEESEEFCSIIRKHSGIQVRTLLHLGCGGGHNDCTFKKHFQVTGIDMSQAMLALARELNPEVTYLAGDMRSVRLDKTFDAVAILDSINYMLSVEDLQAAFETAFAHLNPGGVLLTYVEESPERFRQNTTRQSLHCRADLEVVLVENAYDPDPEDTAYEVAFVYLIRQGGRLAIETDRHVCGIFGMKTWYDILKKVGFRVTETQVADEDPERAEYPVLICTKPF